MVHIDGHVCMETEYNYSIPIYFPPTEGKALNINMAKLLYWTRIWEDGSKLVLKHEQQPLYPNLFHMLVCFGYKQAFYIIFLTLPQTYCN